MTVYSRSQLEGLAKSVGLSDTDARIAAAVALAESSGDTTKSNHYVEKGHTYYVDGLWQISTIHNLGSRESMHDPMTNARAMARLHGELGWKPWKSSQAKWGPEASAILADSSVHNIKGGFIGEGNTGTEKVDIPVVSDISDAANATVDATVAGVKYVGKAAGWLGNPHNWLRIAYVGLGAGVVIVGLAKLAGISATDVASVVPAGKVAAVAGSKVGAARQGSARSQYSAARKTALKGPPAE
jgi:hypothetical protein